MQLEAHAVALRSGPGELMEEREMSIMTLSLDPDGRGWREGEAPVANTHLLRIAGAAPGKATCSIVRTANPVPRGG
jgi:hypothetical protein